MPKIHQVFVGCPYRRIIRKNYDRLKRDLERETPLHIVLADTTTIPSTNYLLEHITSLIRESAGCIFDTTGGNPNVSLEVGIAHALPADFLLALYTRRPSSCSERGQVLDRSDEVKPIIADLQGRNRIEYKTYKGLKEQILARYHSRLPYIRRWNDFCKRNRVLIKPALRVLGEVRDSGKTVRSRVAALLDGSGIDADELVIRLS